MTKAQFVNNFVRAFHKVKFQCKKHSPEILIVTGVVGVVASGVMACKATTKIDTVLDKTRSDVKGVHGNVERGIVDGEKYTEQDGKRDLAVVYAKTGLKLAKLYAPAITLGAASIGCILASHNVIRKRNIALAAAYTAVDSSFKDYRKRVVERFGKDLDHELKYNLKTIEVEEKVVDEDGKEKVVKKTVQAVDPNYYSQYARFFDDGCAGWDDDPQHNLFFLKQQQNFANDLLKAQGYLFLNDVYGMLGIPKCPVGQVVGWIYDEKEPIGDNFVDFGIFNLYDENARRFVNGREKVILLDFNVDGNILDLMS